MSGSKSTKLEALAGGKNEVMNKSALNPLLFRLFSILRPSDGDEDNNNEGFVRVPSMV